MNINNSLNSVLVYYAPSRKSMSLQVFTVLGFKISRGFFKHNFI